MKNSTHLNWRWDLRCITEALLTWSIKQSLSNHQEHPNICIETCYKLSKSLRNCIATPWQPLIKPLHQMILHRHTLLKCSAGALRDYRVPRKCLELVSCIALYQWRAQTSRGAGEKWRYEGKFVDRFRGERGVWVWSPSARVGDMAKIINITRHRFYHDSLSCWFFLVIWAVQPN